MDKKVKQRCVGAIVLIVFACVLIPIVFHSNNIKSENIAMSPLAAQAPAKPKVMKAVKTARRDINAQKIVISKKQLEADQKQALKYFETPTKPKVKPKARTLKKLVRKQWYVQLASFGDSQHAKKLKADIEKNHLHAKVIKSLQIKANKRYELYRVVLGPLSSAEQAKKLQQTLLKLTKLHGLILVEKT